MYCTSQLVAEHAAVVCGLIRTLTIVEFAAVLR